MSRFRKLELGRSQTDEPKTLLRGRGEERTDVLHCQAEAEAAMGRSELQMALRWYGRMLEHDPGQEVAWVGQVRALIEMGHFKQANVWADSGMERFPESPDLLAGKGVALGRLGQVQDAMPFSDMAVERGSANPYVWVARGDVLLAGGVRKNGAQAVDCFDRARESAPGDWWIRWLIGRVDAFWKRHAPALKDAQEAAVLAPERVAVWILAAECQAALGLRDAAVQSYRQVLALQANHPEALDALEQLQQTSWLGNQLLRLRKWIAGDKRSTR